MTNKDDYWVGNGYVLYGTLWTVTETGRTVGGPLKPSTTSPVLNDTPVSKIEHEERDGEEVRQNQTEVIMKHRGRPRKESSLSRSTLWRRQKEMQGALL